jgi:hypothetical protein
VISVSRTARAGIEGREQAKGFWKEAIKALGLKSAKLTTVDAEAVGDSVVEIGPGRWRS